MAEAETLVDPGRLVADARDVLTRLTEDRAVRIRHRDAIRAIRRALAVDMTVRLNRKGDLPIALGLVSRVTRETAVKHRAIVRMMHLLKDHSIVHPETKEVQFPYTSVRSAADAVVAGFHDAGIDADLTPENVEQIWKRQPLMAPLARVDTSDTELS